MSKVVKAVVGVALIAASAIPGLQFLAPIGFGMLFSTLGDVLRGGSGKDRSAATTTIQVGEVPRQAIFGKAATAGSLVDAFNYGGKDGTDWEVLVIALADHRCDALEGFFVNDAWVPFVADGAVAGYNGQLEVYWRPGTETQTVPAVLTANGPGWTANDRGKGVAWVAVAYKADKGDAKNPVWPGGRPRFRWVVRGLRCYQARKDSTVGGAGAHRWTDPATWEWTENPIDIRYNWVRGIYACDRVTQPEQLLIGRGLSTIEAPPANVFARANLCDEVVSGAARYRIGGVVEATEVFLDVENDIAAACAGVIVQPEGAVEIDPGEARAAVAHFTDQDLLVGSKVRWADFLGTADGGWINTAVAIFTDPAQQWQDRSAPVRRDVNDIIADGSPREQQLRLSLVSWRAQAERVAEIVRRFGRLWGRGEVTLPPRFAAIEEGDWVTWQSDRYFKGATRTFRVEAYASSEAWHHRLTLRQISASVYSDTVPLDDGTVANQQPVPPALAPPGVGAWAVAAGELSGTGVRIPALIVTGESDDPNARFVRMEYHQGSAAPGAGAVWNETGMLGPDAKRHEIPAAAGATYYVGVSYVVDGVIGSRRVLGPVTVGNVTYPGGSPVVPPQLGVNVANQAGSLLYDLDVITGLGTSAAIIGQSAWATYNTLAPTVIANRTQNLDGTTGALSSLANVTTRNLSQLNGRAWTNLYRADGVTAITDAAAITSQGTAAGIVGQSLWATFTDASNAPTKLQGIDAGATASENLIPNGDFSNGLTGYTTSGIAPPATLTVYTAAAGKPWTNYAELYAPSASNYFLILPKYIVGAGGGIKVPSNGKLQVTGLVESQTAYGATQRLQVFFRWHKNDGTFISQDSQTVIHSAANTVESWKLVATAPAEAAKCEVRLKFNVNDTWLRAGELRVSGLEIGATAGATIGVDTKLASGSVPTQAQIVTSEGTAAAIVGQSAWATYATLAPTVIANRTQNLDGTSGAFNSLANITTRNLSQLNGRAWTNLFRADGATAITDAAAITSLGTAAAIAGQGALATKSTVAFGTADVSGFGAIAGQNTLAYGGGYLTGFGAMAARANVALNDGFVFRQDGTTPLTDALAVTSLGTAAAIAGQGALATKSAVAFGTADVSGFGTFAGLSALALDSASLTGELPVAKANAGLRNSGISIAANGALSGAGGGSVTFGGLGGQALGLKATLTFGDAEFREAGATVATVANFKTSVGTAAAIAGQGALATKSAVAFGTADVSGFGTFAGLSALALDSASLTGELPVAKANAGLRNSGISIAANGALSGAGGGSVTFGGLGGQALGLKATLTFGDAEFREAGATVATVANFKTSVGTAAAIAGQGALATKSAVAFGTADVSGFGTFAGLSALALDSASLTGELPVAKANAGLRNSGISIAANGALSGAGGGSVTFGGLGGQALGLKATLTFGDAEFREAGATVATVANFKTSVGTAAGITGQGTGATANNLSQLNATEGSKLSAIEALADVTKAASGPAEIVLNYASDGSLLTGLPATANFKLIPAGGAAYTSGVTWAVTVESGSFAGTAPSMSGTGTGQLAVNSNLASPEAVLKVAPTYGGRTYPAVTCKVVKKTAAAASGGGSGDTFANDPTLASVGTTSWVAISNDLTVTPTGTSVTLTAANIQLDPAYAASAGSWNVEVKWVQENGATDIDIGSVANSSPDPQLLDEGDGFFNAIPGEVSCNRTATGLTTGVPVTFRLMARLTSGTKTITCTGEASAQG